MSPYALEDRKEQLRKHFEFWPRVNQKEERDAWKTAWPQAGKKRKTKANT
jgi:hypothetical protein